MRIPRDVSGAHLADILCRRWHYTKVHQVGSHIILETSEPTRHRIAIPDHHPLRLGTFNSILRAVVRHKGVTREAIADLSSEAIINFGMAGHRSFCARRRIREDRMATAFSEKSATVPAEMIQQFVTFHFEAVPA